MVSKRAIQRRAASDERARGGYWIACAALYALVTWLLWPSLGAAPSVLDDASMLQHAAAESLSQIWGHDHFGHFRPAKKLLFWLMARADGDLGMFRALILAAYLATVALAQILAGRVTGARWVALAAAGCFALNPTALGTAAWLSASNLVLCLLALLVHLGCAERASDLPSGVRVRAATVLALLVLALALLCHQLALLAPLLLFAYRRALRAGRALGRTGTGIGGPVPAVYVGSAVLIAAYIALQLASETASTPYRSADTPRWLLVFSAARYMAHNALIWLWPRDHFGVLLVDDPAEHLLASAVCWVALAGASLLVWKHARRAPDVAFGLAWSVLLLAPVSNLLPLGNTPLAAHYMYMPSLGLALALCQGVALALQRISAGRPRAAAALMLAAAALVVWLPDTRRIVAAWGEPEQLFLISQRNHPDNVELLVNLAAIQLGRGDHAAAERSLLRAERLAPRDLNVVRNRHSLFSQTGRFAEALQLLDAHPELAGDAEFVVRRGETLEALERWQEAARAFEHAFALAEAARSPEVRYVAGVRLVTAWVRIEQFGRAEQLARRLLAEYPGRPEITAIARLLARAKGAVR